MTISIIAAVADRGAIGRNGDLLFYLRDDLRRFKALTTGHPVIMGRKTFESLPKGALPGRLNIVISRNQSYNAPGAVTATSLDQAVGLVPENSDPFVIGGGQLYKEAIDIADMLYITRIDADTPDADTFFPEINVSEWELTELSEIHTDAISAVNYRFATYRRRSRP